MQPRLLIGSAAMQEYIKPKRPPKDRDYFSPVRVGGADVFWHPSFEKSGWLWAREHRVATLDELYTIKLSHAYWELRNGSWNKHMFHLVQLQDAGAELKQDLHDMLYKVWEERYGAKKVRFDQTSKEFFTDAVHRVYDHDSIHMSVAYGDRPLYESVLKNDHVTMDMAQVRALPFEDCVRLFREEVYATALERLIIPAGYDYSPRQAYAWALRRTITALTKGWSAQFMAVNYKTFRNPDMDYVARHRSRSHFLIPLGAAG